MKQRVLFIIFSVLFIFGAAYQLSGNRTFHCRDGEWETWNGEIDGGILTVPEDVEGRVLNSKRCLTGKGNFKVMIIYDASVPGCRVTADVMGTTVMDVELPVTGYTNYMEVPLVIEQEQGGISFHVDKMPGGVLKTQGFDITGEQPLNGDYIYLAVLLALLSAFLYYLLFLNNGRIGRDQILTGLCLTAVAIFVSTPMLRHGIFGEAGLTACISVIEGITDALKSGQFPAYVYPCTLNGYGSYGGQFPSLFFYPAAFLRMFGVSLITCYKSLVFAVNLGTGVIAYVSSKGLFGQNRKASLLFSVLYMTVYYRVSVLWNQSALGEVLGMMFLPLIAAGLYELLAGDRKKWWYLAVGYGGLLQCHIPVLVITVLFSLVVGICYIDVFFREKRWVELLKVTGCVLAFNAWYLIPFVTALKAGLGVSGPDTFDDGLLYVMDLICLDPDRAVTDVRAGYPGLSALFCAFLALAGLTVERKKNERQKFLSVLLAAGAGFALMATCFVPWQLLGQVEPIGRLTDLIGYPRCFLGVSVTAMLLAGTGWLSESRFLKKYALYLGGMAVFTGVMPVITLTDHQVNRAKWIAENLLPLTEVEQAGLLPGTDLGDLAPWPRVSDEGKVTVTDYGREGMQARLCFSSQSENQFVEFPLFNYPGYRAFDQNGVRLPVETGTNNRIRVPIPAAGQEQTIIVEYTGKRIFLAGYGITLAACLGLVVYVNRKGLRRRMKKQKENVYQTPPQPSDQ